jgi:hypothetical protein
MDEFIRIALIAVPALIVVFIPSVYLRTRWRIGKQDARRMERLKMWLQAQDPVRRVIRREIDIRLR